MKKNILNIKGVSSISKEEQSQINGGASGLAGCGCDCAGRVTGPPHCQLVLGCLQVYTCEELS